MLSHQLYGRACHPRRGVIFHTLINDQSYRLALCEWMSTFNTTKSYFFRTYFLQDWGLLRSWSVHKYTTQREASLPTAKLLLARNAFMARHSADPKFPPPPLIFYSHHTLQLLVVGEACVFYEVTLSASWYALESWSSKELPDEGNCFQPPLTRCDAMPSHTKWKKCQTIMDLRFHEPVEGMS